MTLEELRAMSYAELKGRVAEFCGWKRTDWTQPDTATKLWTRGECANNLHGVRCYTLDNIPDYPADLNAMREAEENLKGPQPGDYDMSLWIIVKADWKTEGQKGIVANWHATARQRAEALVLTINK